METIKFAGSDFSTASVYDYNVWPKELLEN